MSQSLRFIRIAKSDYNDLLTGKTVDGLKYNGSHFYYIIDTDEVYKGNICLTDSAIKVKSIDNPPSEKNYSVGRFYVSDDNGLAVLLNQVDEKGQAITPRWVKLIDPKIKSINYVDNALTVSNPTKGVLYFDGHKLTTLGNDNKMIDLLDIKTSPLDAVENALDVPAELIANHFYVDKNGGISVALSNVVDGVEHVTYVNLIDPTYKSLDQVDDATVAFKDARKGTLYADAKGYLGFRDKSKDKVEWVNLRVKEADSAIKLGDFTKDTIASKESVDELAAKFTGEKANKAINADVATKSAQIGNIRTLARNTSYSVGALLVTEHIPDGFYLECTTAGKTDLNRIPNFANAVEGTALTDGTAIFTIRKLADSQTVSSLGKLFDAKTGKANSAKVADKLSDGEKTKSLQDIRNEFSGDIKPVQDWYKAHVANDTGKVSASIDSDKLGGFGPDHFTTVEKFSDLQSATTKAFSTIDDVQDWVKGMADHFEDNGSIKTVKDSAKLNGQSADYYAKAADLTTTTNDVNQLKDEIKTKLPTEDFNNFRDTNFTKQKDNSYQANVAIKTSQVGNVITLARNTQYHVNDCVVTEHIPALFYLECVSVGQTANTLPNFGSIKEGTVVNDGTVKFVAHKVANIGDLPTGTVAPNVVGAVSLGENTKVEANNSIAIGSNSVALANDVKTGEYGVVSVGATVQGNTKTREASQAINRRIINVADGIENQDAITKKQLDAVSTKHAEDVTATNARVKSLEDFKASAFEKDSSVVKVATKAFSLGDYTADKYYIKDTLDTLLSKKVDKVEGKQLSTNDYTNDEKKKLAAFDTADKYYKKDAIDSTFATKDELTTTENKLQASISGLDWKNQVANITALKAIKAPQEGWTISIDDTNEFYRFDDDNKATADSDDKSIIVANDGTKGAWVKLGHTIYGIATTTVDGLMSKEQVATLNQTAATAAAIKADYITSKDLASGLDKKVDKVQGKQLSTNDYTNDEKAKLGKFSDASVYDKIADRESAVKAVSDRVTKVEGYFTEGKAKTAVNAEQLGGTAANKFQTTEVADGKYIAKSQIGAAVNENGALETQVPSEKATVIYVKGKVDAVNAAATELSNRVTKVEGYFTEGKAKTAVNSEALAGNNVSYFAVKADTETALNTKVDKVEGKQLSTNDYTNDEKKKLAGLNNYTLPVATDKVLGGVKVGAGINKTDDGIISVDLSTYDKIADRESAVKAVSDRVTTVEKYFTEGKANTSVNAEQLGGTAANKFQTTEVADGKYADKKATETALNTKVDKVEGKQLSTNDYTNDEKKKLAGLNNYTLPVATDKVLGGVKVGAGINKTDDGIISVPLTDYVAKADIGSVVNENGALGTQVPSEKAVVDFVAGKVNTINNTANTLAGRVTTVEGYFENGVAKNSKESTTVGGKTYTDISKEIADAKKAVQDNVDALSNTVNNLSNNMVWKPAVADTATLKAIKAPQEGWTVSVDDTNSIYRFDADNKATEDGNNLLVADDKTAGAWILLSTTFYSNATHDAAGLMSKEDKTKLDEFTKASDYDKVADRTAAVKTVSDRIGVVEGYFKNGKANTAALADQATSLVDDSKYAVKADTYTKTDVGNKFVAKQGYIAYSQQEKDKLAGLNNYTLPVATDKVLGGVKIGSGINKTDDGIISVTPVDISGKLDKTEAESTYVKKADIRPAVFFANIDILSNTDVNLTDIDTNKVAIKVGDVILDSKLDRYFVEAVTDKTIHVSNALGTNYIATKEEVNAKVDKNGYIAYTQDEKTKLAGLNNYTLPVATDKVLGGVKVGAGINKAEDGTISVTPVDISGKADKAEVTALQGYFTDGKAKTALALDDFNKDDYYTKNETDSKIAAVTNGLEWKASVADIKALKAIAKPQEGWTVSVDDTNSIYRFDAANKATADSATEIISDDKTAGAWIQLGTSVYSTATTTVDGLMSSSDKAALDKAVTDIATANTEIGKKANSADVYTKTDADKKYVSQDGYIAYTQDEKTKLAGLNNYTLPVATDKVLGGVKVGAGINKAEDGTISVATTEARPAVFFANIDILSNTDVNLTDIDTNKVAIKVGDVILDSKLDRYFVEAVTDKTIHVSNALGTNPVTAKQSQLTDKDITLAYDTNTKVLSVTIAGITKTVVIG